MNQVLRKTSGAVLVLVVAATSLLFAGGSSASAAPATSLIRAAHFSPTTPGVDVYLTPFTGAATKTAWLSNVSYGTVSSYQSLTPGTYTVSMRLAGADPTTPPALSWVLDARAGAAYTIAGVGSGAAVRGVVIPDPMSAPTAGHGLVRVIQAASRAPVASVGATTGPVISADAQFATVTGYTSVPAGALQLHATSTTDASVTTASTVDIRSGQVESILLLDAPNSGITSRVLVDAAAAGTVPVGSVNAGGGATATDFASPSRGFGWTAAIIGLSLLVGLALVFGVGLNVRRSSHRGIRPTTHLHGRHAAG